MLNFSDSRRLNYESKLLNDRLERQYIRQKIDNQISNRMLSSPERENEFYRSSGRDGREEYRRYLSPSCLQERILSNNTNNISNIPKPNQLLTDSIKKLSAQQKGSSLYQSPNKISTTNNNTGNNPDYQRNVETFLQFDIERKQREQRKKDIMSKINELNQKLNTESSNHSHISQHSQNLLTQQNNPSSGNYTSSTQRFDKIGQTSQIQSTQQQNQSSQIQKYEKTPIQDSVVEKSSLKQENQLTQEVQTVSSAPVEEVVLNRNSIKQDITPKIDQYQKSYVGVGNESKLKSEIQKLESTNDILKQQVEKLEKQHEEITQRLKEQLNLSNQENQKLKEGNRKEIDSYKLQFENEKKKNDTLLMKCAQLESNMTIQNEQMSEQLQGIKQNYEDKLQQFEQLLQESNHKIENIQNQYTDDPLIKAIKENPQILDLLTEKFNEEETSDPLLMKRMEGLENLLERKEEIIRELSRNNELKDLEIKKMEELIEKFKALFGHMNEEKEILTAENDRLNDELEELKEFYSKFMMYQQEKNKYDRGEAEEVGEVDEDELQDGELNEEAEQELEEQENGNDEDNKINNNE